MFGGRHIEHDDRYEMAEEFTRILKQLWSETEDLTLQGKLVPRYRPGMATLKNQGVGGIDLHRGILGGTSVPSKSSRQIGKR
jgi:alkanesulfonate monooxygenase SsuD/methylene tetrahydromethanopterin reductase-like flavin-dependent oxidoreductase (luciferase family)